MTSVLYVLFVILADVLAARWIVPIGFGLAVPAGVFAIAPIFTLRDKIHQDRSAWYTVKLVLVASAISYIASVALGNDLLGRVTIASVVAFVLSELIDTFLYALFPRSTWLRRVFVSNVVSSAIDSIVFITIAFGFQPQFIVGQYIAKMVIASIVALYLNHGRSHRLSWQQ